MRYWSGCHSSTHSALPGAGAHDNGDANIYFVLPVCRGLRKGFTSFTLSDPGSSSQRWFSVICDLQTREPRQREVKVTCPQSLQQLVAEPGSKSRLSNPHVHASKLALCCHQEFRQKSRKLDESKSPDVEVDGRRWSSGRCAE